MNEDRVQEALQQWAGNANPPEFVERAVLAEFDRTRNRKRWGRWTVTAAAVAAGLAIAWTGSRPPEMDVAPQQQAEQVFTALPYVVQPAVYERTEVVRLSVPAAELMAAGLPLRADPASAVEADVLLGQDGRARAVRVVSIFE